MDYLLYIAATLLIGIAIAHSYLGEKYILIRLFKKHTLPALLGGTDFTKNTLRFAWHITSIAWFGFATIIVYLPNLSVGKAFVGNTIGLTFMFHFIVSIAGSRGKHFSWPIFFIIGLLVLLSSNT